MATSGDFYLAIDTELTMSDAGMIHHRGTLCGGQCRDHQHLSLGAWIDAITSRLPEGARFELAFEAGEDEPWVASIHIGDVHATVRKARPIAALYGCERLLEPTLDRATMNS